MRKILKTAAFLTLLVCQLSLPGCKKNSGALEEVEVTGVVEAVKTEIRAQTQGEIEEILIRESQKVNKGDLLCRINADKLRIQMDQIKAGLHAAEAKLRLAKMGTKKEMIAMAKNQMEIAAMQLELAEKDEERMTKLLGEGAVSQVQKEKADLGLKTAQEQYKSARDNYQMALRGREKEEIDIAEAEIQGFRAQEQLLVRLLQDTEVKSPVTGYVEVKHVEPGELAQTGTVLFSLIDLSQTYVKAYVPEKYIGRLKLGGDVEVTCDSFPDRIFKGKVDYVSDEAEFAPRNIQTKEERLKLVFMIKANLENPAGELKPGMPVDVRISFK